ncbi:MAG: hypothetical protein QF733_04025 [Phycisphaerales bacterium]|jgi:hypothetical protein|nr:hypothetical protein [Phycisphaerales bacterium]
MAMGWSVQCDSCDVCFEAWDDGNPWVWSYEDMKPDASGQLLPKKRYVYHPSPESYEAVGNDFEHLCLDCGKADHYDVFKFKGEGRERPQCVACGGGNVYDVCHLGGKKCPGCDGGTLRDDFSCTMIS